MSETIKLRLEYNPKQGCFHFDNFTHPADTHGWVTICPVLADELCTKFYNRCLAKYPVFDYFAEGREKQYHPTADEIRAEFVDFLLELQNG